MTITDPRVRNTNLGTKHFSSQNAIVTRLGAASSADYYRNAGDLTNSSGAIAVSPNYADTTVGTEAIELWRHGLIAGKEILDATNRAMRYVFFTTFVPLSHGSHLDYGMESSTDTDWTDVLTPTTSAKSTTARRTPYSLRSYNLINDAANEGTQSATLPITQGESVRVFAVASANVGTASLQPYDVTNSAAIGTATTHSEEEPQLMDVPWQAAPSTCKEIAVRLLGTTNTSDIFWNGLWLYKRDTLRLNFPSYVTEYFQAPYIVQGIPRTRSSATNIWNAQGLEFRELREGVDYTLQFHHPDANPYGVLFHSTSAFDYPLFIQVRRPYSDLVTFSAESDSTTAPVNQLVPRVKIEIIDTILKPRGIDKDVLDDLRRNAWREWYAATENRPVKREAQRNRWSVGRA